MSSLVVFLILLTLHLSSLLITQTAFVPDEYWQSLEVAHYMVFKYGNLTWEWQEGIRSFIYPFLISLVYKILQLFNYASVSCLVLIPRLLQALLSTVGDAYLYSWVSREVPDSKFQVLFSIGTSWFWLYCASRTLTNTLETTLTSVALYYFPWGKQKYDTRIIYSLCLIAFSSIIRPTAAIPWIPLCLYNIFSNSKTTQIIKYYILIGICALAISIGIDSYFYGHFVCSPFNFLYVNVIQNISDFYGSHPPYWYILYGLPVVLGLHIIPFIFGCVRIFWSEFYKSARIEKYLFVSIIWTTVVYSVLHHKEFRFIMSLLPMALFISSSYLSALHKICSRYIMVNIYVALALGSIIPLFYLGIFHQRGTLDVMNFLAEEAKTDPQNTKILFLMPCHSTPLYSHLHVNVSTKYLSCDPRPLFFNNAVRDEADEFYHSPSAWLQKNNLNFIPSHIVIYNSLFTQIRKFFSSRNYKVSACFFHAHLVEGRVGNSIYVMKLVKK